MIIELKLIFTDKFADGSDELEFAHQLSAPEGFEITGGQLFVENAKTAELQRFAFRIERDDDGKANLTILEDVA